MDIQEPVKAPENQTYYDESHDKTPTWLEVVVVIVSIALLALIGSAI